MEKGKLLATFNVVKLNETFKVYGAYEIAIDEEFDLQAAGNNRIMIKRPEFDNIKVTKLVNGKEEDYMPAGCTWTGREYNALDVIESFVAALIRGDETYTKIFVDEGLQEVVEYYTTEIAATAKGKFIPARIFDGSLIYQYRLLMVTDAFIYYYNDDSFIMLNTEDHSIVSDNYFAEVGYNDSVENIRDGSETLIWGELPEQDI